MVAVPTAEGLRRHARHVRRQLAVAGRVNRRLGAFSFDAQPLLMRHRTGLQQEQAHAGNGEDGERGVEGVSTANNRE